jgi:hypothetical protein
MELLGPQYEMDDLFRKIARKHQSAFRANELDVLCDKYGNMLRKEDAESGLNFYGKYEVFAAVKERFPGYKQQLYANLLRSEHIPFNVFVPFRTEKGLFASVMAEVAGLRVGELKCICIEHAPEPASDYLDDKTSFDVFCECVDASGDPFFLGIEVKYTERGYSIGKKEDRLCKDPQSRYNTITKEAQLYKSEFLENLKTDKFRQVWRNHLLAESIMRNGESNHRYYKSILLYPSGNQHISEVVREYKSFLLEPRAESFMGITFEDLFASIEKHAESPKAKDWVAYLKRRYIPSNQPASNHSS